MSDCGYEFSNNSYLLPQIVIDAVFFFCYLALFFAWLILRLRNLSQKSTLKWWFFGLSLIFLVLGTILDLIYNTLYSCDLFYYGSFSRASISTTWFLYLSSLLLLANTFIILGGALYKIAKAAKPTLVYALSSSIVAIVTIITIVYLGVISAYISALDDSYESTSSITLTTRRALYVAANVLYFIATLLMVAMLLALFVMIKTPKGSLTVWVLILCIAFFGNSLENVIIAGMTNTNIQQSHGGFIAGLVFTGIFTTITYLALLMIDRNANIIAALNGGTHDQNAAAKPQVQQFQVGQPVYIPPGMELPPGATPIYAYVPGQTQPQLFSQQPGQQQAQLVQPQIMQPQMMQPYYPPQQQYAPAFTQNANETAAKNDMGPRNQAISPTGTELETNAPNVRPERGSELA